MLFSSEEPASVAASLPERQQQQQNLDIKGSTKAKLVTQTACLFLIDVMEKPLVHANKWPGN